MSSMLNDVFTVSNSNAKGAVFLLATRKPMRREHLKEKLDSLVTTDIRADNIRRYAEVPFCKYGYWDRIDVGERSHYSVTSFGERITPGVIFALRWAAKNQVDLGDVCGIAWNADGYAPSIEGVADVLTKGMGRVHIDCVANGKRSVVSRLQSKKLVNVADNYVTNTEYGNEVVHNLFNPLMQGHSNVAIADVSLRGLFSSLKFTLSQRTPSTERMSQIFDVVQMHPAIGNNDVSKQLGISPTLAKSYLKSLVDAGKLRYESGHRYSAYWAIEGMH